MQTLVLASTSVYRKQLLERLGIPFETVSPVIDETPRPGEAPEALVTRLAAEKAGAVASEWQSALVIGSDQVVQCGGQLLGKPGTAAIARQQLSEFSGRTVTFLTAVALVCTDTSYRFERTVQTRVRFRELNDGEIERYVAMDTPLDCAGGFKSEAAGISLVESIESSDPTSLIGLPLIAVSDALRAAGHRVP
jgi:septum formation protein